VAESTSITLLASTTDSSPGSGATVTISGRQRAARLRLLATSVTTDLTVSIESRESSSEPWAVTQSLTVTAAGAYALSAMLGPECRVSYIPTGSATFAISGTVDTVFCEPADMNQVVRGQAFDNLAGTSSASADTTRIVNACINATAEAGTYLRSRKYVEPIVSWGPDLRMNTARLAVAEVYTYRGADVNSPDALVYDARDKAISWFNKVQRGSADPDVTDSEPDVYYAGVRVASNPRRGW